MKHFFLLFFVISNVSAIATTYQVEAGGGPKLGTPYFDPEDLVIQVGDIVNWTWVSGTHNVAATSGPESFNSDSQNAPFQWSFTFTLDGFYNYECSLFEHATTQNGTITVNPVSVANIQSDQNHDFVVYPNPANDVVTIERFFNGASDFRIVDVSGNTIAVLGLMNESRMLFDTTFLSRGMYFVETMKNGIVIRRKLIICA